ncbi:hypothetical protein [Chryseobacterium wanjuense]
MEGLNRTIDRKNIVIHRKLPEGIKIARIDLTREDVMNSPYCNMYKTVTKST